MRAVDTNILLRHFRGDDPKQSPIALRVMSTGKIYCAKTVLLEFEMVMRYTYDHSKEEIARCLAMLLNLANVTLEDEQQVAEAFRDYQRGLDFADALHLASSQNATELITFDNQKFARRAQRLGLKPPCIVPA